MNHNACTAWKLALIHTINTPLDLVSALNLQFVCQDLKTILKCDFDEYIKKIIKIIQETPKEVVCKVYYGGVGLLVTSTVAKDSFKLTSHDLASIDHWGMYPIYYDKKQVLVQSLIKHRLGFPLLRRRAVAAHEDKKAKAWRELVARKW